MGGATWEVQLPTDMAMSMELGCNADGVPLTLGGSSAGGLEHLAHGDRD